MRLECYIYTCHLLLCYVVGSIPFRIFYTSTQPSPSAASLPPGSSRVVVIPKPVRPSWKLSTYCPIHFMSSLGKLLGHTALKKLR